MKNHKLIFWISTSLFCAFMLISAIPDLILMPEAELFMKQLGYPDYFTRFIGLAKILGAIALLIPGFPRIKEWAYAGMSFDLIGAVYSIFSAMTPDAGMFFLVLPLSLLVISYRYHHKLLKPSAA